MSQITTGLAFVENGSATVYSSSSADWSSVVADDIFTINADTTNYVVDSISNTFSAYNAGTTYDAFDVVSDGGLFYLSIVGSNTGNTPASSSDYWVEIGEYYITLTTTYGGTTNAEGGAYSVSTDFTPNYSLPLLSRGNSNAAALISRALTLIDAAIKTIDDDQASSYTLSQSASVTINVNNGRFQYTALGGSDITTVAFSNFENGDYVEWAVKNTSGGGSSVTGWTGVTLLSHMQVDSVADSVTLFRFRKIAGTIYGYRLAASSEPVQALGSITGGTVAVNAQLSPYVTCEADAHITAVTVSNCPTVYSFTLEVLQGSGGPYTFADGLTTITTGTAIDVGAADETFLIFYSTKDGGTNWVRLQPGGGALS